MNSEIPQVSVTGRYSIGQTCAALGIHRNTLRSYTDRNIIRCGIRRGSGKKFYTGAEIQRFWKAIR